METLLVRRIADEEIQLVEMNFPIGDPEKHQRRFVEQKEGSLLYLFAWLGNLPLGHAVLKWAGTTDEPMASKLKRCPDISDLFVHEEHRSRGIGTRLLETAETLAKEQKYPQIGLSVGLDNIRARVMYERRGFRDAGFSVYRETGRYKDRDGKDKSWELICTYLVKHLL